MCSPFLQKLYALSVIYPLRQFRPTIPRPMTTTKTKTTPNDVCMHVSNMMGLTLSLCVAVCRIVCVRSGSNGFFTQLVSRV